ncbi:MAG: stage 0 sporulation protein [Candidatus Auribacter fodinae]|jgi:cell fate regulator YaaT (PSP1 superfamily)|uniref:Stage 0 sporulation protein n=1 Tax=Candidatus Auribacter fodinae TaxID=2093366 RepID=A0A3A4QQD3_9BACT|nr:MAG: stage 0 sporulation protein [Candidatus Auribacter fodinae]
MAKHVNDSKEQWFLLRMREAGRNYVCKPQEDIDIQLGEHYIVELDRSEDYARVLCKRVPTADEIKNTIIKRIKRKVTDKDWSRIESNKQRARDAFVRCLRRVEEHELEMKLVDVEYSFDGSKIVFYFTADGRVDFRELVKTLASEFRARIELRQIGVRDESGIIGGIASCGLKLCCKSFLYEFEPVTIKMAKDQRLPLNPAKISGLCGRLLCCLRYENKHYKKTAKTMPREGALVCTPNGKGRVIDMNMISRSVSVLLSETEKIVTFPVDKIKILQDQEPVKPAKIDRPALSEDVDVADLKKLEDIPSADIDDEDDDDNGDDTKE